MSAHDRHLAAYRAYATDAWCETCGERTTVDYEEEYGQGSIRPEECPDCGGTLTLDAPKRP